MEKDLLNKLKFNSTTGELKPGIYLMTLQEIKDHPVLGSNPERKMLLKNLEEACNFYWSYGITDIYIDGSFITKKTVPGDIDGVIGFNPGNDPRLMNILNSGSIWGDFVPDEKSNKLKMWKKYRIEFWDANKKTELTGEPHLAFFQKNKDKKPKGIIKIIR